jgi:hypothetical protein
MFISPKNPFFGIPLENVNENDLILMNLILTFLKKNEEGTLPIVNGTVRKLSIHVKDDYGSRRKHSITARNGKECIPSSVESLFDAYKYVHKTLERVLHE